MPHASAFSRVFKAILVSAVVVCFAFPAPAQEAEQDLPYEFGIYYTAKKGDSLAGIAKRYFDSEAYWPQLWKENTHVKNPHDLIAGERIRLFQKSGNKKIPTRLLALPLPETKAPFTLFSPIEGVGFVRSEPVTPLGSLFKVTGDKALIAEGDKVFLWKAEADAFTAGGRYTLFRVLPLPGTVAPPDVGLQHLLTGVVEVTDVKPDYAIATVIKSYRRIRLDDRVMPYEKRSPVIPLARCQKDLHGTILASEEGLTLMGDGHIAFIDKGQQDGVAAGQQYLICTNEQRVKPDTGKEVTVGPIDFGTLLVLSADEHASAVVITQSDRQVVPGNGFRAPSLME